MTKRISILILVGLVTVSVAFAQPAQLAFVHEAPECVPPGRKALLEARVNTEGSPRVFFRERGAEFWCYVDGERILDKAIVALPEFPEGTQVEYFFVSHVEDRITGRSDVIYVIPVIEDCEEPVARHEGVLALECEGGGALGAGMGNSFTSQDVSVSPSTPEE